MKRQEPEIQLKLCWQQICCRAENSIYDTAWRVRACMCMCACVCVWHIWKERKKRVIWGGWATVQAAREGLVGRKAAFVRSQPPQQLPPTWWTLWEQNPPPHYDRTFHVLLDAPLQVANIDASRESVVGGPAAAGLLDLRLTLKANKEGMQNFTGRKWTFKGSVTLDWWPPGAAQLQHLNFTNVELKLLWFGHDMTVNLVAEAAGSSWEIRHHHQHRESSDDTSSQEMMQRLLTNTAQPPAPLWKKQNASWQVYIPVNTVFFLVFHQTLHSLR